MGKLLSIDGLNIARRVFEANPEVDPNERAESSIRNTVFSFKRLLSIHSPTHAVAAFDSYGITWRHELYPQYKADRQPMHNAFFDRLPNLFARLNEFGIKVIQVPSVEADDIIATVVMRWMKESRGEAIVVSTDKDLLSLLSHGALVWDHFKAEWHDRQWVELKFGVGPERLVDLFALAGDATDGIPGVSRIGVKTAAKLIQNYGDIDQIMANAGILKNGVGERLRAERDVAILSRQLVELKTDIRLGITWKDLVIRD